MTKNAFLKGNNQAAFSPNAGSRLWTIFFGPSTHQATAIGRKMLCPSPKIPTSNLKFADYIVKKKKKKMNIFRGDNLF